MKKKKCSVLHCISVVGRSVWGQTFIVLSDWQLWFGISVTTVVIKGYEKIIRVCISYGIMQSLESTRWLRHIRSNYLKFFEHCDMTKQSLVLDMLLCWESTWDCNIYFFIQLKQFFTQTEIFFTAPFSQYIKFNDSQNHLKFWNVSAAFARVALWQHLFR